MDRRARDDVQGGAHIVMSSVIHAVIYGLVFKVMHQLSLPGAVALVVIVLVLVFAWGRSRDQRGW
jgi:Flp pilus assembly protein TadB